jgi:hypothetical protein
MEIMGAAENRNGPLGDYFALHCIIVGGLAAEPARRKKALLFEKRSKNF